MQKLDEANISKAILASYHENLAEHLVSDVVIVGAGPAGVMAALRLARGGCRVTVLEKRLSPGGGVWGGGMGMNRAVVQDEVLPLLEEIGVRHEPRGDGLNAVDSIELACGLCVRAIQVGASIFNLTAAEDVCVHEGRVDGVVVNHSMIVGSLPVDPLMISARAVLDATGHDAFLIQCLRRRGFFRDSPINQALEGPMNATEGEAFVVERAGEACPGLWVAGMSVCATFGGPRMGPIFGGMLQSGARVAELIAGKL